MIKTYYQALHVLLYSLDPEASLLNPRGKVLEHGVSPRFFRRLAEGVFDIEDLSFAPTSWQILLKGLQQSMGFMQKRLWQLVIQMAPILQQVFSCSGLIPIRWSIVSRYGPTDTRKIAKSHREAYFMSSRIYDPIVSKQEAERLLVYSKMQVPISHSVGKRVVMSEQWRRFRNQKTGCISEPYFFECVPLKEEAGKKMRINKEAKSFGMSWEKEYGYSQAIKVDNTIYVSGQVSHDERGNIVGPGNMDVQMRQAYANIEKVVAQYGATIDNIVDELLFVTDMDAAFAARAKCKQEVFSGNPVLASTIVQIQRLAFPELMVEIRCICKV